MKHLLNAQFMQRISSTGELRQNKHGTVVYCVGFLIIISLWILVFARELSALSFIRYTLLITLGYIAMIYDISTKRIPNALVLTMMAFWILLIMPMIIFGKDNKVGLLMDSIFGLLTGGGLFLLVYLISKKGLGGGDVKFMAAAGLYLGVAETVPSILYGTVLAAITGLVLIITKKIGRKDTIPLAPFLFAGIMITLVTK